MLLHNVPCVTTPTCSSGGPYTPGYNNYGYGGNYYSPYSYGRYGGYGGYMSPRFDTASRMGLARQYSY